MKSGLLFSIILHVVVILLIIFKLPVFADELKQEYLIVTDIVNVSEISNLPTKQSAKNEQKNAQKQQAPKSINAKNIEEIAQLDKNAAKDKSLEKIPDKAAQNDKKQDIKNGENNAKKEQKKKKDDFEKSILKSIEEANKKNKDKKIDQQFQDLEKTLLAESAKEFNPNLQLSINEIDNIITQIKKHWSTAAFSGSPEAKNLRVDITVYLDIDGNVIAIQPKWQDNNSPHYRSFVESAVRAIKLSSPLKSLPKEKYENWKEISPLRFDPSGMIY